MSSLAWTVNSGGEVWTLQPEGGGSLYSPIGFAQDIGVNAAGIVYVVKNTPQPGQKGYIVARLVSPADGKDGSGWKELASPAAAVRIAVDPDGTAWTVNSAGQVRTLMPPGNGLVYSPEDFAQDIGVGADNTVWVVTTKPLHGQKGDTAAWLAARSGSNSSWEKVAWVRRAVRIAVDPDGIAWTVNSCGEVWTLKPESGGSLGSRYSPEGFAQDIGVGADGTVWVVTTKPQFGQKGNIVAWLADPAKGADGSGWQELASPAAAVAIAVQ